MFARDLAELLDHVGWARAVVAGCSMGGNVAQAFAAELPQRTAALGLIDTTAWYGADAAAKFKERADAARSKGLRGMIDFQLTRWFSDASVLTRYGIATVNYGTSTGLPDTELGENLDIDGLVQTAEVYARAAQRLCA